MSCRHPPSVALPSTSAKIARDKLSALPFCFPILGAQFRWEAYVMQCTMLTSQCPNPLLLCSLCVVVSRGDLVSDLTGYWGAAGRWGRRSRACFVVWSVRGCWVRNKCQWPRRFPAAERGVLACEWGARWQRDVLKRAAEEACFMSCSIMKSKNNMHFFLLARFFSFQINKRGKQCQIPFTDSWF